MTCPPVVEVETICRKLNIVSVLLADALLLPPQYILCICGICCHGRRYYTTGCISTRECTAGFNDTIRAFERAGVIASCTKIDHIVCEV